MRMYRRRRKWRAIAEPVVKPANLLAKRKNWTEEWMEQAIECGRSGTTSYNKAAELHDVSKSTLKNRLNRRAEVECCPGPKPYLLRSRRADFSFTQCIGNWTGKDQV